MYKTKHPLYNTYRNMLARCNNPKTPNYKWYGALGVKVCDRWAESFDAWVEDMGPKPVPKFVLARKDAARDYEPSNCQWGPKGSEDRRSSVPVRWEYALKFGEKVSRPLESLKEAKARRDLITSEARSKGRRIALEVLMRGNGGEWEVV